MCAAYKDVFGLLHSVALKHIGEEHTPVEVGRPIVAHILVKVVYKRAGGALASAVGMVAVVVASLCALVAL